MAETLLAGQFMFLRNNKDRVSLAGEEGFEPPHSDPESDVLPLDDSPEGRKILSQQYFQFKLMNMLRNTFCISCRFRRDMGHCGQR